MSLNFVNRAWILGLLLILIFAKSPTSHLQNETQNFGEQNNNENETSQSLEKNKTKRFYTGNSFDYYINT